MSYEEAMAHVGYMESWELRGFINSALTVPARSSPREKRYALAAKVELRRREGKGWYQDIL